MYMEDIVIFPDDIFFSAQYQGMKRMGIYMHGENKHRSSLC